ncbi:MAG: DUF503 domain-containing protein [Pseudomonadales bacterium]|nr:DUF503 domain-containing protein [Pseudomonadales bacterium]
MSISIGIMTLRFHLEGCHSLKEKRNRLVRIRDHFGKTANIAICESSLQEKLQSAQWCYIVTASSRTIVTQSLSQIDAYIVQNIDAVIIDNQIEYL